MCGALPPTLSGILEIFSHSGHPNLSFWRPGGAILGLWGTILAIEGCTGAARRTPVGPWRLHCGTLGHDFGHAGVHRDSPEDPCGSRCRF